MPTIYRYQTPESRVCGGVGSGSGIIERTPSPHARPNLHGYPRTPNRMQTSLSPMLGDIGEIEGVGHVIDENAGLGKDDNVNGITVKDADPIPTVKVNTDFNSPVVRNTDTTEPKKSQHKPFYDGMQISPTPTSNLGKRKFENSRDGGHDGLEGGGGGGRKKIRADDVTSLDVDIDADPSTQADITATPIVKAITDKDINTTTETNATDPKKVASEAPSGVTQTSTLSSLGKRKFDDGRIGGENVVEGGGGRKKVKSDADGGVDVDINADANGNLNANSSTQAHVNTSPSIVKEASGVPVPLGVSAFQYLAAPTKHIKAGSSDVGGGHGVHNARSARNLHGSKVTGNNLYRNTGTRSGTKGKIGDAAFWSLRDGRGKRKPRGRIWW